MRSDHPQHSDDVNLTCDSADNIHMDETPGTAVTNIDESQPMTFENSRLVPRVVRAPSSRQVRSRSRITGLRTGLIFALILSPAACSVIPDSIAQTKASTVVTRLASNMTRSQVSTILGIHHTLVQTVERDEKRDTVLKSGCMPARCRETQTYAHDDIETTFADGIFFACTYQIVVDVAFKANIDLAERWTISRRKNCR